MKYTRVIYEKLLEPEGAICRITFKRPEKLNAIDGKMNDEFMACLDEVEKDDDIKVIILRGAGRAFSAGFDMDFVGNRTDINTGEKKIDNWTRTQRFILRRDKGWLGRLKRIFLFPRPIIAQVHGFCFGGGYYIAMCCDLTVVSEDCKLGHFEQRIGAGGRSPIFALEALQVGWKKARELLLLGDTYTGKEAAEMGLVNKAVPADKLEEEVYGMAQAITLIPRDTIEISKTEIELVYDLLGLSRVFNADVFGHSMFVRSTRSPNEFDFFKVRKEKGLREAIRLRDERYDRYKVKS